MYGPLEERVNQIWLSYTRMNAGRASQPAKSLADYGSELNVQGPPQLPQISVGGFFTLGNQISGPVAGTNVYGLRDVYTTTRGRHTFFLGGGGLPGKRRAADTAERLRRLRLRQHDSTQHRLGTSRVCEDRCRAWPTS